MKKQAIRKQLAKAKRILREKDKVLNRWKQRRARLVELIRVTKQNTTMQGQDWVDGQVGHYEKLLAKHDELKPR